MSAPTMDSSRPRRRLWHVEGARTLRSVRGATIIAAFAVGIGLLIMLFGEPYQVRLAVAAYINLILVLGLQIFMGNANVANLAHPGFMGLGAYLTSIFAVPLVIKKTLIPNAPFGLGEVQLGIVSSFVAAVGITGIIAALTGLFLVRLSGIAATILTLAILVIIHGVFVHWVDLFRGTQAFYGIPKVAGIETMMVATALVILVARLFKDSRIGVQLRASATNMLAAEAMGVNIRALRLIAWVLGGVVCGIAGALYAYYLGTVNARAFYFHAAFLTLAMHILGGMRSVTGAVVGVVLISVAMELIRHLESGPVILGAQLP
ncbi:MAG: branched-chain amino acid ABC transporter permease, partial [Rhodospirillales bacterium]|nr:branched-chain amino acid ABC transporter permease [Rhodospirillales bacterium]